MTATVSPARTAHESTRPRPSAHHRLTGTTTMIRLTFRRNWLRLVLWFVVVVGLFGYVGEYYTTMFPTQQSLDDFATLADSASMRSLTGVAAAANTLGGAVWSKIWMTCVLVLGLGVVFLVTRNGRADEEAGRTELLRSRILGIHAASMASYLTLTALCVLTGLGVAAASAGVGLDPAGTGISGSIVMGASVTGVAFVCLGVAALAGQLASTGRGANATAATIIGVFYILRMAGDLNDSALTWLSPIGWGEKMAPYGPDNWLPFGLLILFGALLIAAAMWMEARRDHGAGLLPDRPGPADGAAMLGSPLGLGLRLQRGAVIGWSATIILAALMFGSVITSMVDLLKDTADVSALLGGTGTQALVAMLVMLIAMVVAAFALQTTTHLRSDEASGILEPQLAGSLSRLRWALGRLAIPVLGSVVLLAIGGACMGVSYGASINDPSQAMTLALAAVTYWPAVLLLVGVAVALFGWLPRLATPVTWALLAIIWFLALIGDALRLPEWLLNATPFKATPYQPLEPMSWTPVLIMTAISACLFAVGLVGFRRRDILPG